MYDGYFLFWLSILVDIGKGQKFLDLGIKSYGSYAVIFSMMQYILQLFLLLDLCSRQNLRMKNTKRH